MRSVTLSIESSQFQVVVITGDCSELPVTILGQIPFFCTWNVQFQVAFVLGYYSSGLSVTIYFQPPLFCTGNAQFQVVSIPGYYSRLSARLSMHKGGLYIGSTRFRVTSIHTYLSGLRVTVLSQHLSFCTGTGQFQFQAEREFLCMSRVMTK
ncbi:hypothetical protein V6N11_012629 [Hibiscus sabdariffa]|uniref:Uncharacterized protein n=1 Tax=Hibiscus sabdariffa TaxID=183260 RepID=A0ABR2QBN9_9ROSI